MVTHFTVLLGYVYLRKQVEKALLYGSLRQKTPSNDDKKCQHFLVENEVWHYLSNAAKVQHMLDVAYVLDMFTLNTFPKNDDLEQDKWRHGHFYPPYYHDPIKFFARDLFKTFVIGVLKVLSYSALYPRMDHAERNPVRLSIIQVSGMCVWEAFWYGAQYFRWAKFASEDKKLFAMSACSLSLFTGVYLLVLWHGIEVGCEDHLVGLFGCAI